MASYVYLVRNSDLYKIGTTNNLQREIKILRPDEIIKALEVADSKSLEARLFRRYKAKRIPDSGYFRLTKAELDDCKKQMSKKGALPKSLSAEVSIALTASLILALFTFSFSLYLGQGFFSAIILSLSVGSLPMWRLVIIGDFGGYDAKDLPLFSSWTNRIKSFVMAALITSSAYTLYLFIK
tara:strand:- start:1 stop:546 length:546 start_codon:yes stop_codon:yes gene_type:complete